MAPEQDGDITVYATGLLPRPSITREQIEAALQEGQRISRELRIRMSDMHHRPWMLFR